MCSKDKCDRLTLHVVVSFFYWSNLALVAYSNSHCILLLSERTPVEHCYVHNMSPFVSSSGLSPGSHEAKVQRAKVCLSCTEPSVARSSCWSLPVGQYLSDTRCKGLIVVLAR